MRMRLIHVLDSENVQYDEGGLNAIVRSAGGDMRRALNTLQTCFMSRNVINEENAKLCTGYPSLSDTKYLLDTLLNNDIANCYNFLFNFSVLQGVALQDIIKELYLQVVSLSLPGDVVSELVESLSTIEYNLSRSVNQKVHIAAIAASFYNARANLQNSK
ncbi:Replication factor C subunit 3 [Thelohanellus kitauei]|uniref:Replication factor C subunit 3 n=1 Tax=Thelohanellus kitauei TaxID=669202 RepID=A0A0C2N8P2_THEKT|nr:Replication factor C subunit 3 [Thelohanellus kitauei]